MANFFISFCLLQKLEFSKPADFLHINKGESSYTIAGIYLKYHSIPKLVDVIREELSRHHHDEKEASIALFNRPDVWAEVIRFYKREFWKPLKLKFIKSQLIANEIFIFATNAGKKTAIKKAQALVGVKVDGIIGKITLYALNKVDEGKFDIKFDEKELQYYRNLVLNKPYLKHFLHGWEKRALYV